MPFELLGHLQPYISSGPLAAVLEPHVTAVHLNHLKRCLPQRAD